MKPALIMLDEPAGGLAPREVRDMMQVSAGVETALHPLRHRAHDEGDPRTGRPGGRADRRPEDRRRPARRDSEGPARRRAVSRCAAMLEIAGLVIKYGPFLASTASISGSRRARSSASSAPTAPAKARSCAPSPASSRPPKAASNSRARRSRGSPQERAARGVSLVPEGRGLFPTMSVEENLLMGGYPSHDAQRMKANMGAAMSSFRYCASGGVSSPVRYRGDSSRCSPCRWG